MSAYSETVAGVTAAAIPAAVGLAYYAGFVSSAAYLIPAAAAYGVWQRYAASGYWPKYAKAYPNAATKTIVVTGANTGIGYETALDLASAGATVVVSCRTKEKSAATVAKIRAAVPTARIFSFELNLDDLKTIRDSVQAFSNLGLPCDVLINNAGGAFQLDAAGNYPRTADGLEMNIGANFIGTLHFTDLMLPHLVKSKGRVVNLSSRANEMIKSEAEVDRIIAGHPTFENLGAKSMQTVFQFYAFSKLGNEVHAANYARLKSGDTGVTFVSCHPGVVLSDFYRFWSFLDVMKRPLSLALKTSKEGAATDIHCALAPEVENGGFYADSHLFAKTKVALSRSVEEKMMAFARKKLLEAGITA